MCNAIVKHHACLDIRHTDPCDCRTGSKVKRVPYVLIEKFKTQARLDASERKGFNGQCHVCKKFYSENYLNIVSEWRNEGYICKDCAQKNQGGAQHARFITRRESNHVHTGYAKVDTCAQRAIDAQKLRQSLGMASDYQDKMSY